jgi:CDP-diacylglycerol--glycerol-3-phosphate 3-phosphatidyltransferase
MPMSEQSFVFTDWVRAQTRAWMSRAGMALHRIGVHPDMLTVAGLAFVALAAFCIGRGQFQLGGLVLVLGLPLDALDGAVARAMGRADKFGGVLDSSLDRYADAFIFGGLSYYFAVNNQFDTMLLAMAALAGSFVVSYVRARAGEAGLSVKVGLFDRFVRVLVIVPSLFIPSLVPIAVLVLAVGTNFTGLQRLWYVYRNSYKKEV